MMFNDIGAEKWLVIFILALKLSNLSAAQSNQLLKDEKTSNDSRSNYISFQHLDSIQSLDTFYSVIRDLKIQHPQDSIWQQIDSKLYQLIIGLHDSLNTQSLRPLTKVNPDSFYAKSDMISLIDQVITEEKNLETLIKEFDNRVQVLNQKLMAEGQAMTDEKKISMLAELDVLEKILIENEKLFLLNLDANKVALDSMKNELLAIKVLEDQLTYSELQRVEEQRTFQKQIFIVIVLVIGFAVLTILSTYVARKFKKQKIELSKANAEVKRINQTLEELVSHKTASLANINKELDTFLYKSSHDLKRPLMSIIGLANLGEMTLDPKSHELLRKTSKIAADMDKMLQKLVMVHQINHPSEFRQIDFNKKIKNLRRHFNDYIKEHNISLVSEINKKDPFESYPALIEIILRNLIENALFFSTLKIENKPEVSIRIHQDNSCVTIDVYDNGDGIKADVRPRIWEMFYVGNEKSQGNGLGLYIAWKASKVLNGTISFITKETSFTKFTVVLPVTPPATTPFAFNNVVGELR